MNTQRIKVLIKAIEQGSLTKAGEMLGYTQSYLTQAMKAYEEEIGFPLLVKTNRGVEATNEAKILLPAMRELIRCEEKLNQEMAEIQGLRKGNLRIGSFPSMSVYWVPQILQYFQNNYPDVVFRIEEIGHEEMLHGLMEGSLDMALMSDPKKPNIDFIPILEDPMLVVMPLGHKLARYDRVPVSKLKKQPFIMTYESYDLDPYRIFEKAGFIPEVKYFSRDDFAVLSMVQKGLGLAIIPQLTISEFPGKYEARKLEPDSYRTMGIALKSLADAGPLTRFVIKYIKENIK